MTLSNSKALHEVAVCLETTAFTAETTPGTYILVEDGSGKILTPRGVDKYKSSKYNRPTLSVAKAYLPEVEIKTWGFYTGNFTGELFNAVLGSDTMTTPMGASTARLHTMTLGDNLDSYTFWDKTAVTEQAMSGGTCDSLNVSGPQDSPMSLTAKFFGTEVNTVSTFGTASYISETALANVIAASHNSITFGVESANITDVTFDIKNGIKADEGVTQGYYHPRNIIVGKDREISGSFDVWDETGEMLLAYWDGDTSSPTATTPNERPSYVSLQCTWTGAQIEKTVGAATQTTGNGLSDVTSGGTFTGTDGDTFVVTIASTGEPDTFTWTKNGGTVSDPVAISGTAQTLSDGVTITFSATTGHTDGDAWTVIGHQFNYYLDINCPSIYIDSITPSESDNRRKNTVNWHAVKTSGTPITVTLQNTDSTQY